MLVTFPLAYTNWNSTQFVPQSDPSSGTLVSVTIIHEGIMVNTTKVENTSRSSGTVITATQKVKLSLSGPGFSDLIAEPSNVDTFNATVYDGALDFGGTSGKNFGERTFTAEQTLTITDPAILALYVGTGTVGITDVATNHTKTTSNSGNLAASTSTKAKANVTVIYGYEP